MTNVLRCVRAAEVMKYRTPNHPHHLIRWARIHRFSGLCGFALPSWRSTACPWKVTETQKGLSSNHFFFWGYVKRWGWKQKRSTVATVCTNWKHDTNAIVYNWLSTRICSELQHVGHAHDISKGNISRSDLLGSTTKQINAWKQTCAIVYLKTYIYIYVYSIYVNIYINRYIQLGIQKTSNLWIMNWDITDFHLFSNKKIVKHLNSS